MSSASMYESSSSQFFRTTAGIQSQPNAFDESRFVMTFLTIFEVLEILCSLRLVLEKLVDTRVIKIRVIRNVFYENFALSDAEDNTTSGLLNRGGIADLPFC